MGDSNKKEPQSSRALDLVYIIGTYPGLSTTFIDREISGLRRRGVNIQVVSIRRFSGPLSPEQTALQQGVIYLLPVAWLSFLVGHFRFALFRPRSYFGTLLYLITRPHPTIKSRFMTVLHFSEGVYAAHLLRRHACDQAHAHFADRAAIVALVIGRMLGLPYSLTAHANDIYVNPVLLPEKLSQASFVATCTGYNQAYLAKLGNGFFDHKIRLIYHGLDADQYRQRDVSPPSKTVVLSVGQLKEKKGYIYLLKACRTLKDLGYNLDCHIVGEGPMRQAIEAEIFRLSLQDTVTLCGALPHDQVIEKYHQASIFILPAILSTNGDRDGIPNVILEAMAAGLPVVSTRHSGIPEVIEHGCNGLLVPPADEDSLAAAIAKLIDDPEEGYRLGQKGIQTVKEKFDLERNVDCLLDEFMTLRKSRLP